MHGKALFIDFAIFQRDRLSTNPAALGSTNRRYFHLEPLPRRGGFYGLPRHYVRTATLSVRSRTFREFACKKTVNLYREANAISPQAVKWAGGPTVARTNASPEPDGSSSRDVILKGGKAAVRDPMTASGFDVVDRNSLGARSVPVRLCEYSLSGMTGLA